MNPKRKHQKNLCLYSYLLHGTPHCYCCKNSTLHEDNGILRLECPYREIKVEVFSNGWMPCFEPQAIYDKQIPEYKLRKKYLPHMYPDGCAVTIHKD